MATESFGSSFGNPSRYIGSSPLGEIGKALKIGATVYGMEKSGLIKYLDELGVKQKNGVFSFENKPAEVPGAVVPTGQPMGGAIGMGAAPPTGMPPSGAPDMAPQPIAPQAMPPAATGVTTPEMGPPLLPFSGKSIIDGTSLNNPDDFNPAEGNYGYTQQLASGNEYQQVPGYGRTAGMMKSMFGLA